MTSQNIYLFFWDTLYRVEYKNYVLNTKLENMWKEAIIDKFEILSRHLTGGTEVNHVKPQ
jgi:hypothetical protein